MKLTDLFEMDDYELWKHSNKENIIISEGLIYTYDKSIVYPKLKHNFPNTNIKYDSDKNKFRIIIQNNNYKKLIKLMDVLGWFPSTLYDITSLIGYKYSELNINKLLKNKSFGIIFEAKYDLQFIPKTNELFHITTLKLWESKIQKIGLKPTSKNKSTTHPDRVYLFFNESDSKMLAKRMHDVTKVSDYVLLKIYLDNIGFGFDIKLFKDPNYLNRGVYTYNNITPNAIEFLKHITFK